MPPSTKLYLLYKTTPFLDKNPKNQKLPSGRAGSPNPRAVLLWLHNN